MNISVLMIGTNLGYALVFVYYRISNSIHIVILSTSIE